MADVFISYKQPESRPIADALFERLSSFGIEVWYDRRLEPSEEWRRKILEELLRARIVLTLWSPAAIESDFVNAESQMAFDLERDLPVMVEDCNLNLPFNLRPHIDLRGWPQTGDDDDYWTLIEQIADRLGDRDLLNLVLETRYDAEIDKDHPFTPHGMRRRVNSYDYTELMRACEELRDDVREFDPDFFVALDARSGLWAEMLFDWIQRRIPVIVGYRTALAESHSYNPPPFYIGTSMPPYEVFLPDFLFNVKREERVLLVLDHSAGFEEERFFRDFFCGKRGHPSANLATVTLIASPNTKNVAASDESACKTAFFRDQTEDAMYLSLFYREGLVPFFQHIAPENRA